MQTIAIDLMGSDASPLELTSGALSMAPEFQKMFLLATPGIIAQYCSNLPSGVEWIQCDEEIEMNDPPIKAARQKQSASLVVGLELLKQQKVSAFITAGNTGALLVAATLTLPLLPGIDRAGLLAVLPTKKEPMVVVDVGGTLCPRAAHLQQFAKLGHLYQRICFNREKPKVGLLNIGAEPGKGTNELKKTFEALQKSSLSFIGNVEGRDAFNGGVDVLVTDGFAGNIFLKTAEGAIAYANALSGHPEKDQAYPGALLCGFDGLIIKCHGHASASSLKKGIEGALYLLNMQFLSKLSTFLR